MVVVRTRRDPSPSPACARELGSSEAFPPAAEVLLAVAGWESVRTPPTLRLVAMAVAAVLLVAACGADTGDATSTAPAGSGVEATDTGPSEDDDGSDVELVSPTETDAPFELAGGAETPSEVELVDVGDDPRSALRDEVAGATAPWPTDWTRSTIDLNELLAGIPRTDPRDAIPPIDTPRFEPIAAADWLDENEPGALVTVEGEVRFYALSILTRHEIVNDRFGDVPVAVTFCPLCNTAISFDRRLDGEVLRLGVSGLLRNSDLVMWDEATTSLWQQVTGDAIVGEHAGARLDPVPTAIVSYGEALADFPDALSLARETGFPIDYGANPYVGYSSSEVPFLFDGEPDPRYPALSRVVGVTVDAPGGERVEKAYPFAVLEAERAVNDELGSTPIAVFWGGSTTDALDANQIAQSDAIGSAIAYDRRVGEEVLTFEPAADRFVDDETGSTWTLLGRAIEGPLAGEQLDLVTHRNEFWFAWAAFFPDAPVFGE